MRRWIGAALAGAALLLPAGVVAQQRAADIPVEQWVKRFEFRGLHLSPSGRYVAAIAPSKGRYNLTIIDLQSRKAQVITAFESADVLNFQWLTDERITFMVGDTLEAQGQARFKGVYLVNVDGSLPVRVDQKIPGFSVVSPYSDVKDEIIIAANARVWEYRDLYRYNIHTGERKLLTFDSPGQVTGWIIDANYVPRVAFSRLDGGKLRISYRDGDGLPWTVLFEGSPDAARSTPTAFDFDGKTMYVTSSAGRETPAIHKWNFSTGRPGEMVAAHPQSGVQLLFDRPRRKLVGFHANADAR